MLLRVRFDDPGWFASDPRLRIEVDGQTIYDGSFRGGVRASVQLTPGTHELEAAIFVLPGLARGERYSIEAPPEDYRHGAVELEARLVYSTMRGSFSPELDLRPVDG